MISLVLVVLCCTAASVTQNSDPEPAPPLDLLTQIKQTLTNIVARLERIEAARDTELEEITQKVDTLSEKVDRIDAETQKIDSIGDKVDAFSEKVDRIEAETQKIDSIGDKVDTLPEKVDRIDAETQKIGSIGNEVGTLSEKVNRIDAETQKIGSIGDKVDTLSEIEKKVDTAVQLGTTVKTRQQAALSEVRLISLYKLTGENNPLGTTGYNPGLVVDGQYVFSNTHANNMRTNSHTRHGTSGTNNKIWIDLGGLFRVYSVRVWNVRDSARSFFDGTEIYVGDDTQLGTLIGTASGVHDYYDFPVSGAKYGTRVTLKQPRDTYIALLEVQVWGNGPYDSTDKFN